MYDYYDVNRRTGWQWLMGAAAVVLLLASGAGFMLWRDTGVRLFSVQTASMAPLIRPGDAVLVRRVEPDQLAPGDVISFRSPADSRVTVTHRLVEADMARGLLITKGDNNAGVDRPVAASLLVGRAERHFAKAGYAIDLMHSPAGLLAAVYLPALLLVGSELRRLTAWYRPQYRHRSAL